VNNWKTPELLEQLQSLEAELALLPCGGNKKPLINKWQMHTGFSIADLIAYPGIRAIGARTGVNTGPLLCFDDHWPHGRSIGATTTIA